MKKTQGTKEGAAKGGAAATGDKKRRNLTGLKRRRSREGVSNDTNVGYEVGISKEVSLACLDYFSRKGIVYKAEWV